MIWESSNGKSKSNLSQSNLSKPYLIWFLMSQFVLGVVGNFSCYSELRNEHSKYFPDCSCSLQVAASRLVQSGRVSQFEVDGRPLQLILIENANQVNEAGSGWRSRHRRGAFLCFRGQFTF